MKISAYEIVNELNKLPLSIKNKLVKIENGKVVPGFDPDFPVSILSKMFEREDVIVAKCSTITRGTCDVVWCSTNYIVKTDNGDLEIDICEITNVLNQMDFDDKKALVGRNTDLLCIKDKTLILDYPDQEFVIIDYASNLVESGSFCFVAIMNRVLRSLKTKKEIIPKVDCDDESNLPNLYFVMD